MNIKEIITNPPRDEYIDGYLYYFNDSTIVAKIKNLVLKKSADSTEIHYGLFDDKDRIVGYFGLEYAGNSMWQVVLVQLAQAYKGMGLGTFLYDYAVMNDKLKVMSDATNTGGPHGSINLWKTLKKNNRYQIVGYDTKTKTLIPDANEDDINDGTAHRRWLALPSEETINESLNRIQSVMKNRYVVWYGPGTTSEYYFNY